MCAQFVLLFVDLARVGGCSTCVVHVTEGIAIVLTFVQRREEGSAYGALGGDTKVQRKGGWITQIGNAGIDTK
jgi:hypothetical protein